MSKTEWNGDGKDAAAVEEDIRDTRDRLSGEIDAIGQKFSPAYLKERAKQKIVGAGEAVVERTKDVGSGAIGMVRENPIPAALIGAGITWMIAGARKRSSTRARYPHDALLQYPSGSRDGSASGEESSGVAGAVDTVKDKAQELAYAAQYKVHDLKEQAGEKMHELTEQVGEKARRGSTQVQTFFTEYPVLAVLGVMVLGAVAGAALPQTEKENELMGSARDGLVDKAQEITRETAETVKESLAEVGQSAG